LRGLVSKPDCASKQPTKCFLKLSRHRAICPTISAHTEQISQGHCWKSHHKLKVSWQVFQSLVVKVQSLKLGEQMQIVWSLVLIVKSLRTIVNFNDYLFLICTYFAKSGCLIVWFLYCHIWRKWLPAKLHGLLKVMYVQYTYITLLLVSQIPKALTWHSGLLC